MYFSKVLREFIQKNHLSQVRVLKKLNRSQEPTLSRVDAVTLSRWVSGKTKPSLSKQILICKVLNINVYSYILNFEEQGTEQLKLSGNIKRLLHIIDDAQMFLDYIEYNEEYDVKEEVLARKDHKESLSGLYKNYSLFKRLIKTLDAKELNFNINVRKIYNNDKLVAHTSFVYDGNLLNDILKLDDNDVSESVVCSLIHYTNSQQLLLLLSELAIYCIDCGLEKKYITLFVRYPTELRIFEALFPVEVVRFYKKERKTERDRDISLIKIEAISMISSSVVFNTLLERLKGEEKI
ncbi:helix-turn-helix domain-containing protein [Vibrio owensii]|uniref:helix-turn-helix domain-containing protein n=1 Tax=Vibrio owensii TaxID=696485 RepID=UPI0040678559